MFPRRIPGKQRRLRWLPRARCAALLAGLVAAAAAAESPEPFEVHPGEEIQDALERAAADPVRKTVRVHAGTYRPARPAQALIWFNRRHDGITLEAVGEVTLTAANPEIADPEAASFPAVVRHVVYFGDGISRRTVLRGFRITGANDFHSDAPADLPSIEPALNTRRALQEHRFFYSDGGGIKVFGRSYPTLENLEIHDNFSRPCGGGISIEHRGFDREAVLLRNCIIRGNRASETGAGVDVLPDSALEVENCLFVGNISNVEPLQEGAYNWQHGSGALTVFPGARCAVRRSTFTENWNGVDDRGATSTYLDSIFWRNAAAGGIAPGGRYELDVRNGSEVRNCLIHGELNDLRRSIDPERNILDGPEPRFDAEYRPRAPEYRAIGFRPFRSASAGQGPAEERSNR